jgi:mRNA-degrading endonuclease RelE of RelBE toxin-antitoxin system
MLRLNLKKNALKFLTDLPAKQFKQVQTAIYRLMSTPTPQDAQQLTGNKFKGIWRCTAGEYRIIYRFTDSDLEVILIDKRNDSDVYSQLDRMI